MVTFIVDKAIQFISIKNYSKGIWGQFFNKKSCTIGQIRGGPNRCWF